MRNSTDAMKDARVLDYVNMVILPRLVCLFVVTGSVVTRKYFQVRECLC